MKVRESGMPERDLWEKFFNPEKILKTLGLDEQVGDVAEFGCGHGTFTIPAAKIINGKVYTLDIEPEMIHATDDEAKKHFGENIQTILRDFVAHGSGLKDDSIDYVMFFNILHVENPTGLLREAYRILRDRGRVGIIHWNHDQKTPRGPSINIRPRPEDCIKWAESAGFSKPQRHELRPYH